MGFPALVHWLLKLAKNRRLQADLPFTPVRGFGHVQVFFVLQVCQLDTLATILPLTLLIVACIQDLRSREIADWIPLTLLIGALGAFALNLLDLTMWQLLSGVVIGFSIALPFAWTSGLGGGDLKLVAALGAWLGPVALICVLFWVAISGMVLALLYWLKGSDDFPYVPAIAIGFAVFLCWPEGVLVILEFLRS